MIKFLIVTVVTLAFSMSANAANAANAADAADAADAYQTKKQLFEEWLILSTCMEYGKVQQEADPKVDSGALVLSCVNEAKEKQALINSK